MIKVEFTRYGLHGDKSGIYEIWFTWVIKEEFTRYGLHGDKEEFKRYGLHG